MEHFEAAPYDDWQHTKETLHRFVQIVGKVRLAAQRAAQPLVERPVPPDRAGHHDATHGPFDGATVLHRLRLRSTTG